MKHGFRNRANERKLRNVRDDDASGVKRGDRCHQCILHQWDLELVNGPFDNDSTKTCTGDFTVTCSRECALNYLSLKNRAIVKIRTCVEAVENRHE